MPADVPYEKDQQSPAMMLECLVDIKMTKDIAPVLYDCMGPVDVLVFPLAGEVTISPGKAPSFEAFAGYIMKSTSDKSISVAGDHLCCIVSRKFRAAWCKKNQIDMAAYSPKGVLIPSSEDLLACLARLCAQLASNEAYNKEVTENLVYHLLNASFTAIYDLIDRGLLSEQETRLIDLHLEKNIHQYIDIAEVARMVDATPFSFEETFCATYGMCFDPYVLNKKLCTAQSHVLNSMETSAEIADLLGYPSSAAFEAAFFAKFGKTPNDYRASARQ